MRAVFILALLASPAAALDFKCEDAAAFYYGSMFTAKMVGNIASSCADNMQDAACVEFLSLMAASGTDLEKAKQGNMNDYLRHLKDQCPDFLPDDPTKF